MAPVLHLSYREESYLKKSHGKLDEKICETIFNTYFCVTFIVLASPFGMTIEVTEKENGILKKLWNSFFSLSLVFPQLVVFVSCH
jgi:hypothetical protein